MPVTKGSEITVELNESDSYEITSVTLTLKQWGSKTNTVTLNTSTDGTNFSKTSVSSSTFSLTASDLSAKAIKFTFSNSSNQIGVQALTIGYKALDTGKTATKTTFNDITEATKTVEMYDELSAAATVTAGEGTVSGAAVTYSSSNEKIATVEEDGTIRTQSPGKAVITASYAGDDTYSPSSASFTLVIKAISTSIMDMQSEIDKNPTENLTADLTFKDVYVTGVNGNSAYISDGNYGMLIYTKDHGLSKGNVLNGKVENANLCLYNGAYEITDFSSTNLTITTTELTPAETTISSITKANIGKYVTVKSLTYNASKATFTDADGNSIAYYDGLGTEISLIDGNKYDVTGVVGYFNALQLMPTEVTALAKTATLKTDTDPQTTLNIDGTDTYTLTYDGDGTVSVESSDTKVATAAYDESAKTVTVTAVGKGTTTITISATAGENYGIPTPVTYTLEIYDASELTETFNYTDKDVHGVGASGGASCYIHRLPIMLEFSKAWGADASDASEIRIYANASITVKATEGYLITGVELTPKNTSSNTGKWTGDGVSLSLSSGKVTWTGVLPSVVICNTDSKQAKLATIKVDYIKLADTGNTVTIGETGKGTYCATANCIVGDGTVTKYITGTEENGTTLTETDAAVLAEGEGVLLNGKAGDYKVYTHTKLAPTKNEDNKLVGCSAATTVPTDAYVMQNQGGNVAFYIVSTTDPITCPAGKAYLTGLASGAKALFFNDSEVTGINQAEADSEETTGDIYTMSGVKVNKANLTKGIYIMNGKKFIIK